MQVASKRPEHKGGVLLTLPASRLMCPTLPMSVACGRLNPDDNCSERRPKNNHFTAQANENNEYNCTQCGGKEPVRQQVRPK